MSCGPLHRPILVVTKKFTEPRRFLIAYDHSATIRKGVETIASSPLFRGMVCHVVTAGTPSPAMEQHLAWARSTLASAGIVVEAAVSKEGDAEKVMSDYINANWIGMLMMGAYGHSCIRQLLVGSTTTAMIRTSTVPLLLLR